MNILAAVNPFENPLVLAAVAVIWVVANLLMKRRLRSEADNRPNRDDMQPSPSAEQRPERLPSLQEVLGQLLGGEPSPQAPGPPTRVLRTGEPRPAHEEEQEGFGTDETSDPYRNAPLPVCEAAERPMPGPVLAQGSSARIKTDRFPEEEAGRFEQLVEQRESLAQGSGHQPGRRSPLGPPVASGWRDPRTIRRAFVASLIFAPPKAFEK